MKTNSIFRNTIFDDLLDLQYLHAPINTPKYPETYYDEDKGEIKLVIPGFTKSEIDIEVKNDILTIKGDSKEENKNLFRHRNFEKRFKFKNLDDENIKAKLEDGILSIRLDFRDQKKIESKKVYLD